MALARGALVALIEKFIKFSIVYLLVIHIHFCIQKICSYCFIRATIAFMGNKGSWRGMRAMLSDL